MSPRFTAAAFAATILLLNGCSSDRRGALEPIQTAASFMGCNRVQTITLGSTVSGTLTTDDCRAPDDSYIDFYELTISSARTITVTMSSGAFDTFLVVLDRSQNFLAADDDSGGGTNSRLEVHLQPGSYIIGANAFFVGATGPYQLTVN